MDDAPLLRDVPSVHCAGNNTRGFGALVTMLFSALGCLPSGAPPAGQHLVKDRTLSGVFFTASEIEGVPSHLLATGPLRQPDRQSFGFEWNDLLADVYHFPALAGSATLQGLLDVPPIDTGFVLQGGDVSTYTFSTDSRGRPVYLKYIQGHLPQVVRFDWTTERTAYVGSTNTTMNGGAFLLSPGRTRIFAGQLTDLDGWADLGSIDDTQGAFIGEDFYYVSTPTDSWSGRTSLGRSKPGAEPELLLASTGPLELAAIQGDRVPQILMCVGSGTLGYQPCGGFGDVPFALFDTQRLVATILPPHPADLAFVSASGDGHWLLFTSNLSHTGQDTDVGLFLFDWTSGATATVNSSSFALPINGAGEWRPGHEELWFYFYLVDTHFGRWSPESGFGLKSGGPVALTRLPEGTSSMFTRDGKYWFSWDALRTVHVGLADDLTAPGFPLHPDGTKISAFWETTDGHFWVGASTTDENRQDLYLVDPEARTSRTLATGGHLLVPGHTRALAILNWESSRLSGDLVLVDLASGKQTLLAENVYAAAVDPGKTADVPMDADRLAPGTRIAFLTRSRLESPYDGLWLATLP